MFDSIDYAKTEHRNAWLRHPILGDPSFDSFEKLGETVHQSEAPYDWAVNGSLFRDPKDGAWHYLAGLYPYGYAIQDKNKFDFKIYKSTDSGKSWQALGKGFTDGFYFEGYDAAADSHPDVVMTYDPETDLYWLAYDWLTNETNWQNIYLPSSKNHDSGAALAYAKSPVGPFTRLPAPLFGNCDISRKLGRFIRAYATTVLKRESDWIALILCDAGESFSWGLACMTAAAPEGPWSEPAILLSVDRPDYYPAPVEFYPCFSVDGTVYAPAASVALNRNYQAIFEAPLEETHKPEAWRLADDGNAWHSRPLPDEAYGIWGQTFHGFVHDGLFTVMYPARDRKGNGTLSVAQRPWAQPHSDGFTFSGHAGKSIAPLMRSYRAFELETEFVFSGTIAFAFDYNGILGPNTPAADATLAPETLSDYKALRLCGELFMLLSVYASGKETVLAKGNYEPRGKTVNLFLRVEENRIKWALNGESFEITGVPLKGGPSVLIAHEFSLLTVSSYKIVGKVIPCTLRYNANDALLGAGQNVADWKTSQSAGLDCVSETAWVSATQSNSVYGKWNVTCEDFTVYAAKSPELSKMRVVVDGELIATVDLYAEQAEPSGPVYRGKLPRGRHGIALYPEGGMVVLDILEIYF